MADDRQSQPQAALPTRAAAISLTESIEDERQKLVADSLPRVAHRNARVVALPFQSNCYRASFRSELDCI